MPYAIGFRDRGQLYRTSETFADRAKAKAEADRVNRSLTSPVFVVIDLQQLDPQRISGIAPSAAATMR